MAIDPVVVQRLMSRVSQMRAGGRPQREIETFIARATNGQLRTPVEVADLLAQVRNTQEEREVQEARPTLPEQALAFAAAPAQGALMNFADELAALPYAMPGGKTYGQALEDIRGTMERTREAHPLAMFAAEAAGGIAPFAVAPAAAAGKTGILSRLVNLGEGQALGNIVRGGMATPGSRVLSGMGIGALAGAGAGDEGFDRLRGAATGALAGGAIGGTVEALPTLFGAVTRMGGPARVTDQSVINAAQRRLERTLSSAVGREVRGTDAMEKAFGELIQARAAAAGGALPEQMVLADLEPSLQGLLESATTKSPVALSLAEAKLAPRAETRLARVIDDFTTSTEPRLTASARDLARSHREAMLAEGEEMFGRLRAANPQVEIDEPLRALLSDPTVQPIWDRIVRVQAAPRSQGAAPLRHVFEEMTAQEAARRGLTVVGETSGGKVIARIVEPSFAALHQIKEILDDRVGNLYRAGSTNEATQLKSVRDKFREEMAQRFEGLREANTTYGQRMRVADAFEDGKLFLREQPDEIAARIARMAPDEVDAYRAMAKQTVIDKLKQSVTRGGRPGAFFSSPAMEERLSFLFPQTPAGREAMMNFQTRTQKIEGAMAQTYARATAGSATARRLAAVAEGDTVAEEMLKAGSQAQVFGTIVKPAIRAAVRMILGRTGAERERQVAVRVAEALLTKDPKVALAALMKTDLRQFPATTRQNIIRAGTAAAEQAIAAMSGRSVSRD